MAYNKPNWFVRNVYNRLAKQFGLGKSQVLTLPGRTSGEPKSVPVSPLVVDGTTYLVSVRGDAEWVRNLIAADLKGSLNKKAFTATLVPVADSSELIKGYRALVGKIVDPIWNKLPDDADHPVYRLAF